MSSDKIAGDQANGDLLPVTSRKATSHHFNRYNVTDITSIASVMSWQ